MIHNFLQYLKRLLNKPSQANEPIHKVAPPAPFVNQQTIESVSYDPTDWQDIGFSPLTWKVLGAKYGFALEEVPTWAYEMMLLGLDTPNLIILAGISKPILYNDLVPYFEDTLKDLGYPILTYDDAKECYISVFIKKIANGIDVKKCLYSLIEDYNYWSKSGTGENLRFIYYAWQELDRGAVISYEWRQITTKDNVEVYCVAEARRWLLEYFDILQGIRRRLIAGKA